jgi:hypothetical protein
MKQKARLFLTLNVILITSMLLICNNTAACATSVSIAAVSAKGTLAVNSTITLQATVLNIYSNSQTRDVGLALPTGLVNQSKLLIKDITISKNSYRFVNFTILINSTGDFELMFYLLNGGAVSNWLTMHLLIEGLPTALPPQIAVNTTIRINTTININNTIPILVNATIPVSATINVSNTLNNFNNITMLCNTSVYNAIVNNMTNEIYNTFLANITNVIYNQFIANITQYFNITQWQQQWQWQNVTIIFPADNGQQTFLYMMAGAGILGVFFLGSATTSIEQVTRIKEGKRKSKWAALTSPLTSRTAMLNRRFKFGLATVLSATLTTLGTLAVFPSLGFDFAYSVTFGLLLGAIGFIVIASLNAPRGLIALLPVIDIGLWLWNWLAGLIMLIVVLVIFAIFIIYIRRRSESPGTSAPKRPRYEYTRKGPPPF